MRKKGFNVVLAEGLEPKVVGHEFLQQLCRDDPHTRQYEYESTWISGEVQCQTSFT